jgi:hypothetical protein
VSAATVRQAFQTFLTEPAITGLQKVFLDEPWFAAGETWNLQTNLGWGAIGWPAITDESEERITLGAATPNGPAAGQKAVVYKVGIVLLFQYLIPSSPTSEDAYSTHLDGLIEAVKARLRSDPKAGTQPGLDGVIFEQSQDPGDLHVARDMPKRTGGKVVAWQLIETTAREIITA